MINYKWLTFFNFYFDLIYRRYQFTTPIIFIENNVCSYMHFQSILMKLKVLFLYSIHSKNDQSEMP